MNVEMKEQKEEYKDVDTEENIYMRIETGVDLYKERAIEVDMEAET